MLSKDGIYWIWYQNIPKLSAKVKLCLIRETESPREIFRTAGACLKSLNVSDDIISVIKNSSTVENISKLADLMEKHDDISVTTYFDFDYPKLLCEINDPPLVLYYKGDISILQNRCIAMVGTRNASEKGCYHARSFAREFAAEGYTVISGMAKGIDAAAHIGALGVGNTCAVLGCGVDVVYPKENKELYNKICQKGVVISEYLPGTRPEKWSFPVRNRIISGLSDSVLLVEAPAKSGAINTVRHAADQNRDVFVLYDNSEEPGFEGNRELIADGVTSVTNPYDIINKLGFSAFDSLFDDSRPQKTLKVAEDVVVPPEFTRDYSELDENEFRVMELIHSGIRQFDEIVMESGLDISTVGYALTMLEFKGYIIQKVGKTYEEIFN